MDPFTIAILAGLAIVALPKLARAAPPAVEAPKPEPEAPVTSGIEKALGITAAVVVGITAVKELVLDPIGDALEKKEQTFDWKHQIRDVLLSGDADHLFVTNPEAPKHQQILVTHTRENLRRAYDFAVAIHPRPSGVHDPFVWSDAWAWYTDYWVRRWNELQTEINEAGAAFVAEAVAAGPIISPQMMDVLTRYQQPQVALQPLAAEVTYAPEAPIISPEMTAALEFQREQFLRAPAPTPQPVIEPVQPLSLVGRA